MRENNNVCKYLDIALQHVSDNMLTKMRRNISKQATYDLMKRIREEVPGIHLRTTLMVGHPGETKKDFEELLQFVNDMRFERMGAFPYSHEDGTYAYDNYKDSISDATKQERMDLLMSAQEKIAFETNEEKIGKTLKVVVDKEESDYYVGRTEYDSPEVDPEVLIKKNKMLNIGEFYNVKITDTQSFDLYGEVI